MFKDVAEAISYIESRRVKRSFEDFKRTVTKYHFNLDQKNFIHIAGTNGKGSSTTYLKQLLMAKGYKVGAFTSPYIIKHNERIQVNNEMISDDDLLRIINDLLPIIQEDNLSMFEIDVCIMLKYFDELDLDYRIIECGIGGLYDKTNVINCKINAITNIGYDHEFMLGDSLTEIANHKLGIVKNNSVLFTTETNRKILDIFKQHCLKNNSDLHIIDIPIINEYPYLIKTNDFEYVLKDVGKYQIPNSLLAINIASNLTSIDNEIINTSVNSFKWPGRFEKVQGIYLDGAHNQDGIKALVTTIKSQDIKDVGIVFSALDDKDIDSMLSLLEGYDVLKASFDDDRNHLGDVSYQEAINIMKNKHQNVIVTGSLHFISSVRKYLNSK